MLENQTRKLLSFGHVKKEDQKQLNFSLIQIVTLTGLTHNKTHPYMQLAIKVTCLLCICYYLMDAELIHKIPRSSRLCTLPRKEYVALENEVDMNIQDDKGQTALIKSIIHNNLEITRLLIENDCDVNKGDTDYKTALHYALFEGKDDIAIFLVLYGADINATSKTGDKPIEFANAKLKKALLEIYNEISGRNDEEEKSSQLKLSQSSKN
eukprot:403374643